MQINRNDYIMKNSIAFYFLTLTIALNSVNMSVKLPAIIMTMMYFSNCLLLYRKCKL